MAALQKTQPPNCHSLQITGPLLPIWASLPAPPHHHHPPLSCLIFPSFSSSCLLISLATSHHLFFFLFLDHVPHTPGCPPGSAACPPYTNNLTSSDWLVMGCGSTDTEGGSPKASQAINDSFPPYSSINRQVVVENLRKNVLYLHSGISVLPEIVFLKLICHWGI